MNIFDSDVRLIAQMAMLDKGVIPMPIIDMHVKIMQVIRNQLSTLSAEDQRIAKRKFRKLHRKVANSLLKPARGTRPANRRVKSMNTFQTIDGNRKLSPKSHLNRNMEVWSHMLREAIAGKI